PNHRFNLKAAIAALFVAGTVGCATGPVTVAPPPVDVVVPPSSQPISQNTLRPPPATQPVFRGQTPGTYDAAPAVHHIEDTTPGSTSLTRSPMRPSGDVQQVQFEQGPPI